MDDSRAWRVPVDVYACSLRNPEWAFLDSERINAANPPCEFFLYFANAQASQPVVAVSASMRPIGHAASATQDDAAQQTSANLN
ncbi:hypothetical protein ACYX7E_04520 [Luteimonas sp. RIT-PG2_3]